MGLASPVKDLSDAVDAVDAVDAAGDLAPAIRGALAAACRKTRLDSMVILFLIADSKSEGSLRKIPLQEYCNSQRSKR
jgi:hypothetical protein